MKTGIFVLLVSFLLGMQACSQIGTIINNQNYSLPIAQDIFILQDSIEFNLDEETAPIFNYMQYFDLDSIQMISFLNEYNNSIYTYNYVDKSFIGKQYLGKNVAQGFCIDDSLYVYSYEAGTLAVMDKCNDEINRKLMITMPQERNYKKLTPYPYVTTTAPLKKHENYIIAVGYRTGETKHETENNRPVLTILDLETKELQYRINYPPIYSKYNWGGRMTYRLPYYTVTSTGKIVLSFPACHEIVVGNIYDMSEYVYKSAGSHLISEISSFPYSKNTKRYTSSDVWEWYMKTPSYESILYDEYRNLYYRIARLPDEKYELGERGNRKPIIIIVLDEKFNYLGEYAVPMSFAYFPSNIFVSRDGLNIQVLSPNEDLLKFHIYEYVQDND